MQNIESVVLNLCRSLQKCHLNAVLDKDSSKLSQIKLCWKQHISQLPVHKVVSEIRFPR